MFLPGVPSSGLEFRERTKPNPGLEFGWESGERTWPNTGLAGSQFGERNG